MTKAQPRPLLLVVDDERPVLRAAAFVSQAFIMIETSEPSLFRSVFQDAADAMGA